MKTESRLRSATKSVKDPCFLLTAVSLSVAVAAFSILKKLDIDRSFTSTHI